MGTCLLSIQLQLPLSRIEILPPAFSTHLLVTALHALELQQDPNCIFTHILHMTIAPNFTTNNIPKKTSTTQTALKLQNMSVFSVKDILEVLPAYRPQIEALLQCSQQVRIQDSKTIRFAVVMLVILQCWLARVIPLGIEGEPPIP